MPIITERYLPQICALSLALYSYAFAIPLSTKTGTQSRPRSEDCGFVGNPDLYGLGIRLGVYFQWLSELIIILWYPEGHDGLTSAYLSFMAAVQIAVIVIAADPFSSYAAEVLVLLYILCGGAVIIVSANINSKTQGWGGKGKGYVPTLVVSTFVLAPITLFSSWFWLNGIENNFSKTPCGSFGFLFARVSLYKPAVFRIFAAVSIFYAIGASLFVLGFIFMGMEILLSSRFVVGRVGQLIDTDVTHKGFWPSVAATRQNLYNENAQVTFLVSTISTTKKEKQKGLKRSVV
jgi:hypothetical protein